MSRKLFQSDIAKWLPLADSFRDALVAARLPYFYRLAWYRLKYSDGTFRRDQADLQAETIAQWWASLSFVLAKRILSGKLCLDSVDLGLQVLKIASAHIRKIVRDVVGGMKDRPAKLAETRPHRQYRDALDSCVMSFGLGDDVYDKHGELTRADRASYADPSDYTLVAETIADCSPSVRAVAISLASGAQHVQARESAGLSLQEYARQRRVLRDDLVRIIPSAAELREKQLARALAACGLVVAPDDVETTYEKICCGE